MGKPEPRPGDVVTIGNALWAVIGTDGREMSLLRLNEQPAQQAEQTGTESHRAPNVLNVFQVAAELGVSPKTVREFCKTGQIKAAKFGSSWRILRSENPMLAAV